MIDDLSKRLLELKFKLNHSIKSKCLKWLVKTIARLQRMKNTQSKIKPIKTGKKKLEQRIVEGVKITPIILNHKK